MNLKEVYDKIGEWSTNTPKRRESLLAEILSEESIQKRLETEVSEGAKGITLKIVSGCGACKDVREPRVHAGAQLFEAAMRLKELCPVREQPVKVDQFTVQAEMVPVRVKGGTVSSVYINVSWVGE